MRAKFFVELREFLLDNENCSSDEMEELLRVANKFEVENG